MKKIITLIAIIIATISIGYSQNNLEFITKWVSADTINNPNDFINLNENKTFDAQILATSKKGTWQKANNTLMLISTLDNKADTITATINGKTLSLQINNQTLDFIPNISITTTTTTTTTTTVNGVTTTQTNTTTTTKPQAKKSKQVVSYESNGFSLTSLLRGILGMLVIVLIAYLFSSNRKAISWRVVITGLGIQLVLAISVLYFPPVQAAFEFVGKMFVKILDFTDAGTQFLFNEMGKGKIHDALNTFIVKILPTIIFFSALTSILFYYGIIQKVVYVLAWVMAKLLKLSGAESLSVAGNIFLGQTESPLMIKAYLEKMNKSEILLVMAGGMATLAGGVLAVYINFLGGDDPAQRLMFAKHLLAASIMAAPGVIVVSKILVPQTEEINKNVEVTKEKIGKNVLDSITNGTSEGLKLAVNVASMLLVFVALISMLNYIFMKFGGVTHLNELIVDLTDGQYKSLSLEFILGYTLAPLMWLLGVDANDIALVGQMLGEKLILTEFIGYSSLAKYKAAEAFSNPKSIIMATYMLCGFANFASIGIQIGGIGALAPKKRVQLTELGMKALLAGTLASLLSATIVGMIIG